MTYGKWWNTQIYGIGGIIGLCLRMEKKTKKQKTYVTN
jgi:hypothetical protein